MAEILVVDNEPDIVRIVVRLLAGRGHRVRTVTDGFEALEAVHADPPDLIIVDLQLPTMDGFEVCERLKADETTRGIPVLMMTAPYFSLERARQSPHAGADEYVVKPFLSELLVHHAERLLRSPGDFI